MKLENLVLESDRYYDYLSEKNKEEIIQQSHFLIEGLSHKYNMEEIKKEFKKNSFEIIKCNNENENFMFRARIEIGKQNKIYIYEDTIKKSLKKFKDLTYDQIYNMYLAHEFFHFLEYKKIVNTDYCIHKKMLIFKQKVKVLALSELSANLFAQKMTNSKISPMELDLKEIEYEI